MPDGAIILGARVVVYSFVSCICGLSTAPPKSCLPACRSVEKLCICRTSRLDTRDFPFPAIGIDSHAARSARTAFRPNGLGAIVAKSKHPSACFSSSNSCPSDSLSLVSRWQFGSAVLRGDGCPSHAPPPILNVAVSSLSDMQHRQWPWVVPPPAPMTSPWYAGISPN